MGYSIDISSDKEITEAELDTIISNVPPELGRYFPGKEKQDWGWSLACDLWKPQGKKMRISGSYTVSGDKAEAMRDWLKQELKKNGHKVRCSKMR